MNLLEILSHIPPSDLTYDEWTQVGMALKHEGYTAADWDAWSKADARWKAGECERKWHTFKGNAEPVTAGTIVQMAKERGLTFFSHSDDNTLLDFDGVIAYEGEAEPVARPALRDPVQEIITYLRARFEPSEYIGYVTSVYEDTDTGKLSRSAAITTEPPVRSSSCLSIAAATSAACSAMQTREPVRGSA